MYWAQGLLAGTIYEDGNSAHWNENPTGCEIEETVITINTERTFTLVEGGGFAISLISKR